MDLPQQKRMSEATGDDYKEQIEHAARVLLHYKLNYAARYAKFILRVYFFHKKSEQFPHCSYVIYTNENKKLFMHTKFINLPVLHISLLA